MHTRRAHTVGGPAVRPLRRCQGRARATVFATAVATIALMVPSSVAGGSVARSAAARSCVAFAPTSGDRHLTVFLDAGHGGIDPGGVGETESGQTIYEEDETLPVELDTAKLLEAKGFTVVVSRTDNQLVGRPQSGDISDGILTIQGDHDDVATRDVCANDARANVLLGIYFDAGGSPDNAGCVTGYDTDRPFSAQNLQLATLVQNDVLNAMNAQGWGIPSLGVTNDTQLGGPALSTAAADYSHLLLIGPGVPGWFSTPSEMPGALIEPLFITDPFEGSIAASTSGQQVIAGGLAQAVEQYFAPATTGKNSEAAPPGTHHTRKNALKRTPGA
jgi:N-acetylmuramoyl-L-alanine amidase